MIISASRRTDIPSFYGDWFINRLKAGFCRTVNPFNAHNVIEVSLRKEDIDAIVFWTKNPEPFYKHIDFLEKEKYNFYFQVTLNSYPKVFEPNMPDYHDRINAFIKLSDRIGKEKVIWRYDPIIISSLTSEDFHLENFKKTALKLKNKTNRVVISFLDFYGKVKNNIAELEKKENIQILDLTSDMYKNRILEFSKQLSSIAIENGLEIFSCAENIDLKSVGINKGCCIDGDLIYKLFDIKRLFKKDSSQRKECLCVESKDIGMYNTCQYGCKYCYATYSPKSAEKNKIRHNPESPFLIGEESEYKPEKKDSLFE